MNESIPSFKSPPLNEVFFGVQYEPIQAFDITTYGSLWENFKEHFPVVENHAPIDPSFEKTGARKQPISELSRIRLESFNSAALPRAWFISMDERELVQIQPDRFIRNWRQRSVDDEYPRYEQHIRSQFLNNLETLSSFYQNNGMGELKPNQCEVSYINHIGADIAHDHLSDVFLGWSNDYDLSGIADIESAQINIKHIINDDNGQFVGRLHVNVQPAFTVNGDKPIFVVELTLRGRPLGEGLDGVMKFMDMGREKIVRAFTKMTTQKMHDLWCRER